LGKLGLQIERLPGGHLTTNEQPEALAALIANFERGLEQECSQLRATENKQARHDRRNENDESTP
jgi:hypothetical protein